MEKKVIIVQTSLESIARFQNFIKQEYPRLEKNVVYTDSFDEALSLVPEEGELVVISCNSFNDRVSDFRKLHETTIPENLKNGVTLAKRVKEKNSKARCLLFTKQIVEENEYVDEFIPQTPFGDMEVADVLSVLDKIGFYSKQSFIH